MKKEEKTNVMRILDLNNIPYKYYCYLDESKDVTTNGEEVAKLLNKDPNTVYKTLVTVSNTKEHFVFMIPVSENLDLKKAAKAVGVKSIEMIPQKELLPLTSYVHGGCSPIGMKTKFKTLVHEDAMLYESITFSAGKIGYQVELDPNTLIEFIDGEFIDLIK